MHVLSWNIQWGRGADGNVDLARTISVLRAAGRAEIICLQEVACGWPGLKGQPVPLDGPALLGAAMPEYQVLYFPCLEQGNGAGGVRGFGNLIMSRLPVGQVFRHLLPAPPDPAVPSMQRGCLEVVVTTGGGALRILSTHLEYYSQKQRLAQATCLAALQRDAVEQAHVADGHRQPRRKSIFGLPARPEAALLCGDMNCEPDSAEYQAIMGGAGGPPVWCDAWTQCHPGAAHAPTVGLHGAQWPDREYCCDYFFASEAIAPKLQGVRVLAETAASDHQPVMLELQF